MIEGKDQCWLGTAARLTLWQEIDVECCIGPIFFDFYREDDKYRV